VEPGQDLAAVIFDALTAAGLFLQAGDLLVVAQKIFSKVEGRIVRLDEVRPGAEARKLAAQAGKDPRVVELILRESTEIVRCAPNVIIARHRLGFVVANAGIDRSNVGGDDPELVALLPESPDRSCTELSAGLERYTGLRIPVIMNDSFGRPWRLGTVGTAIGVAGIAPLLDRRGERDAFGRVLEITEVAVADQLAAAASLLQGEAAEMTPVVLVRGLALEYAEGSITALVRPKGQDLFR
jgi:coenzyme F420-0:L-glutamate ligase/coenzyme F420-1:gamma-L-glutamate ligase